ncbi:MAG: DNA mismatch repair protein, partial [Chloroflexota bacterium]
EKISVLSKTSNSEYVGGVIDNSGLDQAITDDLTPKEYKLGSVDYSAFEQLMKDHNQGTIIRFEGIKEGIKNNVEQLKELIALYFRFSLLDEKFNIWLDNEKITYQNLVELASKTQFLWYINKMNDPFLGTLGNLKGMKIIKRTSAVKGFIASVETPKDLKIYSTEEKIGVDLFVNGRLREKDILKHIPTARLVENYLYGQIHFDELDDPVIDRFTSSREGIIANDAKFQQLLEFLKGILTEVIDDWDKWRVKNKEDGDPDNPRYTKRERKSRELFNAVSKDYALPKKSDNKEKVDTWVDELAEDAQFNFSSYAECFISENLVRKYIQDQGIALSPEAQKEISERKNNENNFKNLGNISIAIRRSSDDLCYLSMDHLANLVDKEDPIKKASLSRDAKEYKPIRDALAHTALLTDLAKNKLTTVYENVKGRVRSLLLGK